MHKSNEDCFYFLTSSCTKGPLCTFRHSPLALASNTICASWSRGNCLDPACPHRHTKSTPRPTIGNGILCFYENTPMGCLKLECTFIHSKPRTHLRNAPVIRPSAAALAHKDVSKPIDITPVPIDTPPQITPIATSENNITQATLSTTALKPSSTVKSDSIPRRIAVTSNSEAKMEIKTQSDQSETSRSPIISTTRSVITDCKKVDQEEKLVIQSRIVIGPSAVIAEPSAIPNRKILQTSLSSSTRVVVTSDKTQSLKQKSNDPDQNRQENTTKKFKSSCQSIIDIPCSMPAMPNHLPFMSSEEKNSNNDTKPIRLNRDRLPTSKTSNVDSSISTSKLNNKDKPSTGTFVGITFTTYFPFSTTVKLSVYPRPIVHNSSCKDSCLPSIYHVFYMNEIKIICIRNILGTELSRDEERRTLRIERFQKKPVSQPQVTGSLSPTAANIKHLTDNKTTSPPNERKRTAPETFLKTTPPPKRLAASPSQDQSLPSSVSPTTRPRFVPQPIEAPSSSTKPSRLRQPPSTVIKQFLTPVTKAKSIEQIPSKNSSENQPSTTKPTAKCSTSNSINEEDENQLLKLNEPTDIVDTFALIDEVLQETDHLLELM
ncbi:unnamed protein product [Adineta ricciae]|uniref:C3H1-type domain-containing protein n=1 Tax=Adineta ricciae TaxID=249248 RepID=A0A815IVU1_ADIRI|nr:unnamed protein product [Adineta ricciae]